MTPRLVSISRLFCGPCPIQLLPYDNACFRPAELVRFDRPKMIRILRKRWRKRFARSRTAGAMAVEEMGAASRTVAKQGEEPFAPLKTFGIILRGMRTVGVVSESKDVCRDFARSSRGRGCRHHSLTNPTSTADSQDLNCNKYRPIG